MSKLGAFDSNALDGNKTEGKHDDKTSAAAVSLSSDQPRRSNTWFHNFRYVVIMLGGVMMGMMMLLRLSITVAMVSMVNHTALYIKEHPNSTEQDVIDFFPPGYQESGDFEWTNEIQQIIISGYMVAYTLPQVFTTKLSMKYGIKLSMALSLLLCALSNLLTPTLSYLGWVPTLMLRLINGIGASAILPSMVNVIEEWMPYNEAAKGLAIFQFTCNLIYASSPLISGLLSSIHWKWAYYVPGVVGVFICILWYLVVSDNPHKSRFISQKELDMITNDGNETNPGEVATGDSGKKKKELRTDLPWYFMFKIKNFYALTLVWMLYCSSSGGLIFLLPSYFNRVLQIHVGDIGRLYFIVQIGCMFSMLWPHPVANALQSAFSISVTTARRIITTFIACVLIPTYLYLAAFHTTLVPVIAINRFIHNTCDTIVLATVMAQFGKEGVSGIVYSMINTIGNLTTVFFCWIVGRFLDYTGETLQCWSGIFITMALLNVVYWIVYVAFCPSKPLQLKLNKPEQKSEKF